MYLEAEGMAQQLRAYTPLSEDLSSGSSAYNKWITSAYNSGSREFGVLF